MEAGGLQNNDSTVKPRYNAVAGRHLLGPRYKRGALYVLSPGFFLILYIFFDCKLLYLLCTLPRCTFTTHYVYCIFIRICFIALSKRNQNICPKQVGFCLCSASHCRRSMTVLAKQTTPLALCCLRSVIKVDVPNK